MPGVRSWVRADDAPSWTYACSTRVLSAWLADAWPFGHVDYAARGTYRRDPRVDAYIDALPDWQQAICRGVRELVHAADPEVEETIKRTGSRTSCCRATLRAARGERSRECVPLRRGDRARSGGHHHGGARQQDGADRRLRQGETMNARADGMFQHIIANNRAGGWRKLKGA